MTPPNLIACPSCGEFTQAHRVCASCGQYKGRQVLKKSDDAVV